MNKKQDCLFDEIKKAGTELIKAGLSISAQKAGGCSHGCC
jgi:hypothetical protein